MHSYPYQVLHLKEMKCASFICVYVPADIFLKRVAHHTLLRTIATARVVLPGTIIRLAAGRNTLSESEQAMCFMAGANAVFTGEQMLTTPCTYFFIQVQTAS